MNSHIDSTLVPIQKPVQNRLLKAAGIRKEVATMRATMTLFILPLLILASACGGQEGSPDTGNDDRPIVESPLPPTTDAGMVPETDAGIMPAPDAETPPSCEVPPMFPDRTMVKCNNVNPCRLFWNMSTCTVDCVSDEFGTTVFTQGTAEEITAYCQPIN